MFSAGGPRLPGLKQRRFRELAPRAGCGRNITARDFALCITLGIHHTVERPIPIQQKFRLRRPVAAARDDGNRDGAWAAHQSIACGP
jgi:hypothetical protein